MPIAKNGTKSKLLKAMLSETSGRIMHAMALDAQDSALEAEAEWLRAAACEEQVACLLEVEGHAIASAVHYVSAASCYAEVEQYVHAVALIRSALSFPLREVYRTDVEKFLKKWLPKAKAQLRRQARKQPAVAS